ncbi:modification methylase HemK family [Tepidicaulis marinus]|uniref:Release factor glutamine methyltransferase n=2 Tax=Tepidicaulis marinus TaxID=1333998 RepID=A0A081BBG5_9HYPH|nr:modification methylase HemK family [Tepidicaulis marinus]
MRRQMAVELTRSGIETPALDARLLLCAALGVEEIALILAPEEKLSIEERDAAQAFLERRLAGEPVSRILGRREFWGLSFGLNDATLDPRPDSETLVETALRHFNAPEGESPRVLDLGTGTGCLLLALLHALDGAWGLGTDRSEKALRMARQNAAALGLERRAAFACADWGGAFCGRFHLVVSNPPYIPYADIGALQREVRDYDPHAALNGGEDGLDPYRVLFRQFGALALDGGIGVFEFGAGQETALLDLAERAALDVIEVAEDLAGKPRVMAVRRR